MDASRRLNANTATTDCRNTRCAPSQSPAPMRWATCTEKPEAAEEPCGCRHQAYRRRGLSAEASNHRCVDILHHYRRQLRHNRRHTQHHRQAHLLSSRHSPTFADHRQQPVCLSLYSHNSKCKINQNFRTGFLASISPSFSSLIIIAVWLRPIFCEISRKPIPPQ